MQIGEVSLETDDVCGLSDFYRRLLHLPEGDGDPVHQLLITGGTGLSVGKRTRPQTGRNESICLAFTVDDVDAEYERLRSMEVEILEPPVTRPWGARNMSFLAPDGNAIYFRTISDK